MAAEASRSSGSADSYLGSLISLTSKSEIRYEGVLFTINTEEASIGLRNVRSFGTEGRKKDGPQVPPIDKVYEYIVFRGSDIKDLQVKSSPPPQTASIQNDPAIIQSQYSQAPTSASLPHVSNAAVLDASAQNSQISQSGLPRSPFQSSLPLHQPEGSISSRSSSAIPPASGPMMPMYQHGLYGASTNVQSQQQPMLQPPQSIPGQSVSGPDMYQQGLYGASSNFQSQQPPMLQPPQSFPGQSVSGPDMYQQGLYSASSNVQSQQPPMLQPPQSFHGQSVSGPDMYQQGFYGASGNLQSQQPPMLQPTQCYPGQSVSGPADTSMSLLPSKTLSEVPLPVSQSPGLPHTSPVSNALDTKGVNTFTNQMKPVSSPMASYNGMPEPLATAVGSSTSPMLVTPGQFVQPGSAPLSASQHMQASHKVVESVQLSSSVQMQSPAVSAPASASVSEALPKSAESQAPLLPLPPPVNQEFDRVPLHNRYIHEGRRGRGRGSELLNSATRFTEDFDFEAMNEKFNKNEVWGHLGKAKVDDNEDSQYNDNVVELPQFEAKPVYNKDDFFDSLTSNFHGNGSRNNGRPRFSEQRRFGTNETYGEFSSYRGGQGERGPGYGRFNRGGYYGRGYGNAGSGRGQYNVYRAT